MQKIIQFNSVELLKVDEAVKVTEELINNYFKMSSGQWLKNCYDIKTAKDLAPHECVDGPVAQVIKYEVSKKEVPLRSFSFSLYKVCLQDSAILSTVDKVSGLMLEPFLLYILTHELVHVVRFLKYQQRYENKSEADVTIQEERKVHQLTHKILHDISITGSVSGLSKVFDFYRDWRLVKRLVI